MFRRLFAIETAAIQDIEHASGRYEGQTPPSTDGVRDLVRPMGLPAYYGMVSARVAA